jgi:hypothetical protein
VDEQTDSVLEESAVLFDGSNTADDLGLRHLLLLSVLTEKTIFFMKLMKENKWR